MKKDEADQLILNQSEDDYSSKEVNKNLPPVTLENMYDEQVTYFKTKMCPLYSKVLR